MYIWSGILIENELKTLKNRVIALENELDIPTLFDFPMHISAKISFEVPNEEYPKAVDYLEGVYSELSEFSVPISGIEFLDAIVWVRAAACDPLKSLSNKLNVELYEKFGVPVHEYDRDHKYHSTLCMGNSLEKTAAFYERIKDEKLPKSVAASYALIAVSESGKTHDFKTIKKIRLKKQGYKSENKHLIY